MNQGEQQLTAFVGNDHLDDMQEQRKLVDRVIVGH
jgi:hypothetical protein